MKADIIEVVQIDPFTCEVCGRKDPAVRACCERGCERSCSTCYQASKGPHKDRFRVK